MKRTIELFNVSVDLQPSKNWRELALQGRKSMSYKIFGHAKAEDGSPIAVSCAVNALFEGEAVDIGTAELPAFGGLLAKYDEKLDSAKIKFGADGRPEVNADGTPVYDEPAIICEDGSEFDLFFGTLHFATLNPGVKLVLVGAELTPALSNGAQRYAKDAKGEKTVPIFDAAIDGVKVERRASANGPKLRGRIKIGATAGGAAAIAARVNRQSAPDTADMGEIES